MINRALGAMAKTYLQPLWWHLYRVSIGGLGYMNADPEYNGEARLVREWASLANTRLAPRSPVVFDVGANEGDFAATILDEVEVCEVHCFEPHPKTYARLARRYRNEPRVLLNNFGLSSEPGTFPLYDYAGSDGSAHSSFLPATFVDLYKATAEAEEAVVVTLDDYVAERRIAGIDFLKIDVEGLEESVLVGGSRAITDGIVSMVQLEFNAHNLHTGTSILSLSRALAGFEIYRVLSNGLAPVITAGAPYSSRVEIFKYANLLALRSADGPPKAMLRS